MLNKKATLFIVLVTLLVAILNYSPSLAQSSIDDVIVTEVDSSGFPQVNLRLRALDTLNRPVAGVVRDSFTVTEDGEPMPIDSVTEAEEGIWVHFVIDAGAGMTDERWQRTQDGLLNFLKNTPWMRDGMDHISISVVDWSGIRRLVDFTGDSNSLISVVETFSPSGAAQYSDPLPEVDNILDELDLLQEAEGQAKFVVLISPGLESGGDTERLARKSLDLGIPIYTTLVRSDQRIPCQIPTTNQDGTVTVPSCDENLRDLAQDAGGRYVHYQDSNSLNEVFREMTDQRLQYDLSYRSSLGNSGTRQIELAANAGGNAVRTDATSYDIEVNPPRVLIESPRDGQLITRKSPEYVDDRGAIPPTTQSVAANVLFPDNPRRLLRATLFVDGAVKDEINNPQQDAEFSWNLREITELGITDHVLHIEVEDELGLISQSPPTSARVEVVVPPKPTEAVPIDTIVTRIIELQPSATPIPCFSPDPLCDNIERPVRRNPLAVTSLFIALASLTFAIIVWFNRDKAPVRAAIEGVSSAVTRITKRIQRSEPRAYLEVIAGDVNIGKVLEVYGDTPVGRSRQNAELLFQQDDEGSPLSRLHCTIIDEEDHFLLRDEDSANGTYLNGSRLQPMVAEELVDGDEIELARVERGGVRLQFRIAQVEETGLDNEFRETRRTSQAGPGGNDEDLTHGDRF